MINFKQQNEIKKQRALEIVETCKRLEKQKISERNGSLKVFERDQVLSELRESKLNEMVTTMKKFDNCHNPETLRQMYLQNEDQAFEYELEGRQVIQEYLNDCLNPLRKVAKIELAKQKKINKIKKLKK